MADPYLGEIQAFAFGYYPRGWALCDGSLVPIASFSTLYGLLGTTYGGNGTTNFALPNLTGRVAMSQGQGPALPAYRIGAAVGQATETLTQQEMPSHTHPLQLGSKATTGGALAPSATANVAIDPNCNGFVAPPAPVTLSANAIAPMGGSGAHPNNQPTLAMVYCIATQGTYPQFN